MGFMGFGPPVALPEQKVWGPSQKKIGEEPTRPRNLPGGGSDIGGKRGKQL